MLIAWQNFLAASHSDEALIQSNTQVLTLSQIAIYPELQLL